MSDEEIVIRPDAIIGPEEKPYNLNGQTWCDYCFFSNGQRYRVPILYGDWFAWEQYVESHSVEFHSQIQEHDGQENEAAEPNRRDCQCPPSP